MKRAFKLEGLNCANCAEKIVREIKALEGVNFASINFMTAKMVIDGDDVMFDEIVKAAQGIVARYEPDVVVKKAYDALRRTKKDRRDSHRFGAFSFAVY